MSSSSSPLLPPQITTPVTTLLNIPHPILLAGMNVVSSPQLAAAVSNSGGLGVIGGGLYTPQQFLSNIRTLKSHLSSPSLPFGVDLMVPKVGGSARKTNYDYNGGHLEELVDIMISEKVTLFVCAIGLPPKWVVERLHKNGILYMNMCGAPKHALAAAKLGADMVCAQGGEAGGHTGEIPTTILIPAVKDAIKGYKSPFTGKQVGLVAGGGVYNGRGLAGMLGLGADAVWVGTRFILCEEAGSSEWHQEKVRGAGHGEVVRSSIFTGRPLHSLGTEYVRRWEEERKGEMRELESRGIIAVQSDLERFPDDEGIQEMPILMGKVAAMVEEKLPARRIVEDMVVEAAEVLRENSAMLVSGTGAGAKL